MDFFENMKSTPIPVNDFKVLICQHLSVKSGVSIVTLTIELEMAVANRLSKVRPTAMERP